MSRVGLIVEFEVSAAHAPALHAALAAERAAVAAGEPGCVLFDVLLWDEAGLTGAIVEIYADSAAREAHRATPWLAEVKRALAGLDVRRLRKREGPRCCRRRKIGRARRRARPIVSQERAAQARRLRDRKPEAAEAGDQHPAERCRQRALNVKISS
jgi:quinol monooxygenase YgiN